MTSKEETSAIVNFFSGWRLTRVITVLLIANFVITLLRYDINNKETVMYLIRITAKLSFILFMITFVASSLFHYVKNTFTTWLLTNRRYLGVTFAVSHYIHLAALFLMIFHLDFNVFEGRGIFNIVAGVTAYSFITIMTITSFKETRNLFGKKNWKHIHTLGGYLLWVIFAQAYVLDMSSASRILFAVIAITVLVLRVSVVIKKR